MILAADTDVEGVKLRGDGTAIVCVAEREKRTNERGSAVFAAVLEIEKQRCAAVKSSVAVAEKDGRTPLMCGNA